MLDWLFNGKEMLESTKSLLIAVGVILIIIITLKILDRAGMVAPLIKTTGKVLSILLVVAILGTGAYSIAYLNSYYKREGGIYGKLTDYVYNSISMASDEEDETITYDFANLVFTRDLTEEKYSIVFTQQYNSNDHKTKFQEGTKYSIYVYNNEQEYECNDISYDTEWIHSEYSYVFYDSYQESDVIGDDTLTFDFCFYDNYSYLKITSDADESTIQLWNAYFNKYNFKVIIKVVDDVFIPTDSSIDAVEEGFVKITYYFNDEIYKREVFPTSNGSYTLPAHEYYNDYYIVEWFDGNKNVIDSISLENSLSLKVYAHYGYLNNFIETSIDFEYSYASGRNFWTDGETMYYSEESDQYTLDKETSTWIEKSWNGLSNFNGDCIWTDGKYFYYSNDSTQYILNQETSTWNPKTWNGITSFNGSRVWTDGENLYCSDELDINYILDKETSTWIEKTWNGRSSVYSNNIWSDSENIYYSNGLGTYILDKETSTWTKKTWSNLTNIAGRNIWSDGKNIYYSDELYNHYILDKETSTWIEKTWNGLTDFSGYYIWNDGINTYYSYKNQQYILNKETSTWKNTYFWYSKSSGNYTWSDDKNVYYSHKGMQCIFNKNTNTFSLKQWNGLTSFDSTYIWSDGDNIYYSAGTEQYILNQETSTWVLKTWNGLTNFQGNYIWSDEKNIYYSYYSEQYVLDKLTSTWLKKTWNGLTSFNGESIWAESENIYCDEYVLNSETWVEKTWNGLTSVYGKYVWNVGEKIYYSFNGTHYILNNETSTWNSTTWLGITDFSGSYIWHIGENVFLSDGLHDYKLTVSYVN